MRFNLSKTEAAKLQEVKEALTTLFGDSGDLEFIISDGSGVGESLHVESSKLPGHKFNITDYDLW